MRRLLLVLLLAAPRLCGEGEIRLLRRAPDYRLRFRDEYRVQGQRPLSLVLGGGSAKGLAHIGVLEALEEEGLTEDAITGTSAGALMGAFRAAGFGGSDLRWAFTSIDFGNAIFDSRRRTPGTSLWEEEERHATVLRVDRRPEGWEMLPGEVSGRAATQVLAAHLLRADALCGGDFSRLAAPFACISSDLTEGRLHRFTSGNLVLAVRSSMSLPGVFRPVKLGSRQLVDGGISQNLPVLEARHLHPGAVQVAVDLSDPWESGVIGNPFSLVGRSLTHSVEVMTQQNREAADLLLKPAVDGVDIFDFHLQVDDLARRGRQAFHQGLPCLEQALYGQDGATSLGVTSWRVVDGPPGLEDLARACLPADGPWLRRDAYRLLRRALAAGLVAEIWLETRGSLLEVHARPNPPVTGLHLDVPQAWRTLALHLLDQYGLRAGAPFREPAWGGFLRRLLMAASLEGRPLLDLQASTFTPSGELRVIVREATLGGIESDYSELRPESQRALDRIFLPMLGRPLDTRALGTRFLEAEETLNLQSPSARLVTAPGSQDWLMRIEATDRYRMQVNAAAGYETTWGLHGVFDLWARDFLVKGNEWRVHGFANRIQQGASLSLRHAMAARPTQGYYLGGRLSRHRFEGDPFLGYFGTDRQAGGYPDFIENAHLAASDLFAGLFQRFGRDGRGLAELEYQRRDSTLSPQALPRVRNTQDSFQLCVEWDCLDRHTLPTEGLLLRFRGQGGRTWTRLDSGPQTPGSTQIRGAYGQIRALAKDLAGPVGLDVALETGLGWRTVMVPDRQFILGGDGSLIGTPSTRFLAPNFAILRAGLPVSLRSAFGGHVQFVPRVDYGRFAENPSSLTAGMRALGVGAVIRGSIGKFYTEAGWGTVLIHPFGPGPATRERQFNMLVGARPFDLWARR